MIKVVVFDFDGVLVDSNKLKYIAFFNLFSRSPKEKKIVKETLKHSRERSRYTIFGKIFNRLKRRPHIKVYARKYNEIVESGVNVAKEIPGAKKSLKTLFKKKYHLYIISTAPRVPLLRIVKKRNIKKFFRKIYGGSDDKTISLRKIVKSERVNPREIVMVGDGKIDLRAALDVGCYFIGISNAFNRWSKKEHFLTLRDLINLPKVISKI